MVSMYMSMSKLKTQTTHVVFWLRFILDGGSTPPSSTKKGNVMIPLPMPEIISVNDSKKRKFVVIHKLSAESNKENLKHLRKELNWLRKPNDPNAYIVEEIHDVKWEEITDKDSEQTVTPTDKDSIDSDTKTEK